MDYLKAYNKLIIRAQFRTLPRETYSENHHIIPRCKDKNSKETVKLLAREHFICHFLLIKIYPDNYKLLCAFFYMCNIKRYGYRINNKQYEWLRIKFSKSCSENLKGKNNPNYGRRSKYMHKNNKQEMVLLKDIDQYKKDGWEIGRNFEEKYSFKYKIWINNKTESKLIFKDLLKSYSELGWFEGKLGIDSPTYNTHFSEETKIKIGIGVSRALKGKPKTEEHNQKNREANKNWKHINNRLINIKVKKEYLSNYLEEGWELGWMKK